MIIARLGELLARADETCSWRLIAEFLEEYSGGACLTMNHPLPATSGGTCSSLRSPNIWPPVMGGEHPLGQSSGV